MLLCGVNSYGDINYEVFYISDCYFLSVFEFELW